MFRRHKFRKTILANLKKFVARKKIWIKYAFTQKIKLETFGFKKLKDYVYYLKHEEEIKRKQ